MCRHFMKSKLNIAILGSGNIGTDLLIKVLRSPYLYCTQFIGRNLHSPGMQKAQQLGVLCSDRSINTLIDDPSCCDLVFDATSAKDHLVHAPIFKQLGIKVVDMTPSQMGDLCVPAINLHECLNAENVNMITCGGQASIPLVHALSNVHPDLEYVEVVSSISSKSAGPKTRENIDEYIENTEKGLQQLTSSRHAKAMLNLNPATPCIDMQTTIYALVKNPEMDSITQSVEAMRKKMNDYVPGYHMIVPPTYTNGRVVIMIKVKGLGDYLPQYAGNLDIINCAAIAYAEEYAKSRLLQPLEL